MGHRTSDLLTPPARIDPNDKQFILATDNLRDFVAQAWHVVEPETDYKSNWHIDIMCEHLEACRKREIRNLLINIPPRMMKSLTCSVFFPAWNWIHSPGDRYLYASYSDSLATDHSVATRRVVESEWYQARWGNKVRIIRGSNLKTKFETTKLGSRVSTSVQGSSTGKGANFVVVDDPHNVKEAESDVKRIAVLEWWDKVMASRFNDPLTGVRIIVMQRVHEQDLSGHVLEQGGYTHLNLPMEYEPKTFYFTGFGKPDPRTEDGELLFPERIGREEVDDLKLRLGSRAYAGQYQQRPAPAEGAILKRDWFMRYTHIPELVYMTMCVDTASKKGQQNDYTAIMTMGAGADGGFYVLDVYRAKLEFPEQKRVLRSLYETWQPNEVVVEDTSNGTAILQSLSDDALVSSRQNREFVTPMPMIAHSPGSRDKEQRVHAISPYVEARRVLLPTNRTFVDDFLDEAVGFPNAAHDDMVDTLVMALERLVTRVVRVKPLGVGVLQAFGIETDED